MAPISQDQVAELSSEVQISLFRPFPNAIAEYSDPPGAATNVWEIPQSTLNSKIKGLKINNRRFRKVLILEF
jgi:hypothetical protein